MVTILVAAIVGFSVAFIVSFLQSEAMLRQWRLEDEERWRL